MLLLCSMLQKFSRMPWRCKVSVVQVQLFNGNCRLLLRLHLGLKAACRSQSCCQCVHGSHVVTTNKGGGGFSMVDS